MQLSTERLKLYNKKHINDNSFGNEENIFKLTIELVPSTCWSKNLRNLVTKQVWDNIRKKAYRKFDHKCGICGVEDRLNCHEVWEYDDDRHIQKLVGFIALCDLCHFVKHIGFAGVLASRGELNFEDIVNHFIKINNCSKNDFVLHNSHSKEIWLERSKYDWTVDFGKYKEYFAA